MKRLLKFAIMLPLLLAIITGVVLLNQESTEPSLDRRALYDNEEVVQLLSQKRISIGNYFNLRRNAQGEQVVHLAGMATARLGNE